MLSLKYSQQSIDSNPEPHVEDEEEKGHNAPENVNQHHIPTTSISQSYLNNDYDCEREISNNSRHRINHKPG